VLAAHSLVREIRAFHCQLSTTLFSGGDNNGLSYEACADVYSAAPGITGSKRYLVFKITLIVQTRYSNGEFTLQDLVDTYERLYPDRTIKNLEAYGLKSSKKQHKKPC